MGCFIVINSPSFKQEYDRKYKLIANLFECAAHIQRRRDGSNDLANPLLSRLMKPLAHVKAYTVGLTAELVVFETEGGEVAQLSKRFGNGT